MRRPREWDAINYDQLAHPHVKWGGGLLDRLPIEGLNRVLDAGCGTGRVTELLLQRAPHIECTALDSSEQMLLRARDRLARFEDRVEFVQADLSRPIQLTGSFDAVISTATFHWILDHRALFQHIHSMLRPGGLLIAQWGGEGNVRSVEIALREVAPDLPRPWHFPSAESTNRVLLAAGFCDVEVWTQAEPVNFPSRAALAEYLAVVVLGAHLEAVAPRRRKLIPREVADRLPRRQLDYVRLNAVARANEVSIQPQAARSKGDDRGARA